MMAYANSRDHYRDYNFTLETDIINRMYLQRQSSLINIEKARSSHATNEPFLGLAQGRDKIFICGMNPQ